MYTINDLYDLTHTLAGDYLARFTYPWEALSDLADCIRALGAQLDSEYLPFGPEVWVHRTAHVAPTASITGPCIIGPETEVRHCAFIRGLITCRRPTTTMWATVSSAIRPTWAPAPSPPT